MRWASITSIVALLTLTASHASAQVTWDAGFKLGVNFANLRGDTQISGTETGEGGETISVSGDVDGYRTGFVGGGFATANITDAFGIRLELLYSQKGGKGDISVTVDGQPAGVLKNTVKLDYLEIPVLAVGSFPAGNKAKFNVFGGPAVAFNVSAKDKAEFLGEEEEVDIGEFTETTDFGIALGAGVTILAHERANVVIEGRYTIGLISVDKAGVDDLKNNAISIMVGMSFPIGAGGS
jgi:hypothetical protein